MTQYIDKTGLVAEIKRRKEINKYRDTNDSLFEDEAILSFIDTLEVKEVDLDKAARKWEEKVYLEKGWKDEYGIPHAPFSEIGNAFREGAKIILKVQKGE